MALISARSNAGPPTRTPAAFTAARARSTTGVFGPCWTAVDQKTSWSASDLVVTSGPPAAFVLATSGSKSVRLMYVCWASRNESGSAAAMAFHLAEKSAVPGTRPTKSPFHRNVGSATNIATVPPPLLVIWYDPYETPPASPTPEDTAPGPRPPVSYFSDNIPSDVSSVRLLFPSHSPCRPNARSLVKHDRLVKQDRGG